MSKTRKLTETALLLALALCFQSLRYFSPLASLGGVLVIGSLVNLVLFVTVGRVGVLSAMLISIVMPLMAVAQGHLMHIYLVPAVAAGNCILAIVWWLFYVKFKICSQTVSMLIGAFAKFLFLWWAVPFTFRVFLYSGWEGNASKILEILTRNMSWPQLVTAIVGGYLAVIVLGLLPKKEFK